MEPRQFSRHKNKHGLRTVRPRNGTWFAGSGKIFFLLERTRTGSGDHLADLSVVGHSWVGTVGLKTDTSALTVTMSLSFVHRLVLKMFCYKYETVDKVQKLRHHKLCFMCRRESSLLTTLKCCAMIVQPPVSKQCIAVLSHSRTTPPCLQKLAGNSKLGTRQQYL